LALSPRCLLRPDGGSPPLAARTIGWEHVLAEKEADDLDSQLIPDIVLEPDRALWFGHKALLFPGNMRSPPIIHRIIFPMLIRQGGDPKIKRAWHTLGDSARLL